MSMQAKHKYRVNVYLGKEIYEELEKTAIMTGLSVASLAKVLITTGYNLAKSIENKAGQERRWKNGN